MEDVMGLINSITNNLEIDYTKDNPVDKFKWIPYGKAIEEVFSDSDAPVISRLQNNLATVLQDLGEYEEAIKLSEKALNVFKNTLPPSHPYIKIATDIYNSIKKNIGR